MAQVASSPDTQEIRYHVRGAESVELIWGVSGWQQPDTIPPGTWVHKGLLHTTMEKAGDTFRLSLSLPVGTQLDFGFQAGVRSTDGRLVTVWDGRGILPQDYQAAVTRLAPIDVIATPAVQQQIDGLRLGWNWFRLWIQWGSAVLVLAAVAWLIARLPAQSKPAIALLTLSILTGLGLALRVKAVFQNQRLLQAPFRFIGDEQRYDSMATQLLQGQFFPEPSAMPLYPIFLAMGHRLFGEGYEQILVTQAWLAALTVPLTYVLACRFGGRTAALIAALIVAVHPALVGQPSRLYTEALYTPLLVLSVLTLIWALATPHPRARLAMAGGIMGILTLCRPVTALMPLLVATLLPKRWTARERLLGWLTYSLALGLVILPWTIHNSRTHGRFIPLGVNLATLWQGSPEFYHLMQHQPDAMNWIWQTTLNPAQNGGMNIATVKGDREINARAVRSILAEPLVYAWYSLKKLGYFWIGHPGDASEWPFDGTGLLRYYENPRQVVQSIGPRLLMLLATLVALVRLRRRWAKLGVLIGVCVYFNVMYAPLVALARHSEPLFPLLAILISLSFVEPGSHASPGSGPGGGRIWPVAKRKSLHGF